MGLVDKLGITKKNIKKTVTKGTALDQPLGMGHVSLTKDELNIILQLIRSSNFNGDLIEPLYVLTVKLTKMYERL